MLLWWLKNAFLAVMCPPPPTNAYVIYEWSLGDLKVKAFMKLHKDLYLLVIANLVAEIKSLFIFNKNDSWKEIKWTKFTAAFEKK